MAVQGSQFYETRRAAVRALPPAHFDVLSGRQREVIELRFLAEPPNTVRGIAARFGVSEARVDQIQVAALQRLGVARQSRVRALVCRSCSHERVAHLGSRSMRGHGALAPRGRCQVPGCACGEYVHAG